jgi:hypothetical protein
MSKPKKERDAARRLLKRARGLSDGRNARSGTTNASIVQPDIHREVRHITQLAQAEDSRIVSVGKLVLFSTHSRDAWLLDPEDRFAICLCREGEPQAFRIIDGPSTFAIEWSARFEMAGTAFVVEERPGRIIEKYGYPVAETCAACRMAITVTTS